MPTAAQEGHTMVQQRTHNDTFQGRLSEVADNDAAKLPSEKHNPELKLKRVEQATSNINKWLGSKICGKAC